MWPGHPLDTEARETLQRLRLSVSELRDRIDATNRTLARPAGSDDREVTVYLGQFVKTHNGDIDGDEDA